MFKAMKRIRTFVSVANLAVILQQGLEDLVHLDSSERQTNVERSEGSKIPVSKNRAKTHRSTVRTQTGLLFLSER